MMIQTENSIDIFPLMFTNTASAHRVSQNSMNLWYGFDGADLISPNVPKTCASWAGVSDCFTAYISNRVFSLPLGRS